MIVNCAGGQACCLNDGGENPAGGILAPSPSDMEKILAAIQIVNPRMKIMGGI